MDSASSSQADQKRSSTISEDISWITNRFAAGELGRGNPVTAYHIAQVNIGRIKAPLEDPVMKGFVARLDEINTLADTSPGFVWRLQSPAGNATYRRPYDDDRILINMSAWETIDALKQYVYYSAHAELLRQRHDWFEKFAGAYATRRQADFSRFVRQS
jgi:hypothetical protein